MSTPNTDLPAATLEPAGRRSLTWMLPALAAILAVVLLTQIFGSSGTLVLVRAQEGHGIEAGDALRYRGVEVGLVEEARLAEDLQTVELRIRLLEGSEAIAREGSRFWVVRPELTVDSIQGLETVVGARHVAVDPGPQDGPRRTVFEALGEQPAVDRLEEGGMELALWADSRFGLQPGAPVTFRGVQVGHVISVELAGDSASIDFQVWIRPPYTSLVRSNTVFWETGGVELDLSLTEGLSLDVGTLRSLLIGGIALATPPTAGAEVSSGERFRLHRGPEEDWTGWSAPLPIGLDDAPDAAVLVRGRHTWTEGRVFTSDEVRSGWLIPVEGAWLGPADVLTPNAEANEGTEELRVGSERLDGEVLWRDLGIARVARNSEHPTLALSVGVFPDAPVDAWVLAPGKGPAAISADRFVVDGRRWRVTDPLRFDPNQWNGALVLTRDGGERIGMLLVDGQRTVVQALPR